MSKAQFSFETVLQTLINYHPQANQQLLTKAYLFAKKAHEGQTRNSGESFIVHPLDVAQILADLKLDLTSIIAGFLHDTVEDTQTSLEEIEQNFGKEVASLVDGVTKLSKIQFKTKEESQAENFRKIILAMSQDIRVILIKIADRLSNMRTLKYQPAYKQKVIAQETLDLYIPLANRLGLGSIKMELEDICLKYLDTQAYDTLVEKVLYRKQPRDLFIEKTCKAIKEKLLEYQLNTIVIGRTKHFYSIYNKMQKRQLCFEDIFDIIGFRVIVDNITECYKALGILHTAYKPIHGRFKDYIAIPKANGYQSLHSMVISPQGERIELQIRTFEMHQMAQFGIAAHWKYKEGKFDIASYRSLEWVNRLLEWNEDVSDPKEFLDTVKTDLFPEEVFVFTPKGEVKKLPRGSNSIDFAYAVHTNIGHQCIGTKINGKIASLKTALRSGDTVQIITSQHQNPSDYWLTLVKSSRAKARIRQYLRNIDFHAIPQKVTHKENTEKIFTPSQESKAKASASAVLMSDTSSVTIRPAKCCNPIPGDDIIGFISQKKVSIVHDIKCAKLKKFNPHRLIETTWNQELRSSYVVKVKILTQNGPEALGTISQLISNQSINIVKAQAHTTKDKKGIFFYFMEVKNLEQLQNLFQNIQQDPHVLEVSRVQM